MKWNARRWIYLLVGLVGVYGLLYMLTRWMVWSASMNFWNKTAYIILVLGGLNWLVYALTGGKKDIFEAIGMK